MAVENNDIQTWIRKYVRDEMSPEEKLAFEKTMARDEGLKQEVEFAQLIYHGLEKRAQISTSRHWFGAKYIFLFILIIIVITATILFFALQETGNTETTQDPQYVTDSISQGIPSITQAGGISGLRNADRATAVDFTSGGTAYISGYFRNHALFGKHTVKNATESQDIFITRLNKNMQFEELLTFGSPYYNDNVMDIEVDNNGDIVVTGTLSDSTILRDELIRVEATDDAGKQSLFIAKFTNNFYPVFLKNIGGQRVANEITGRNIGYALSVDSMDNIVFTGTYIGKCAIDSYNLPLAKPNENMLVAKLSPTGEVVWVNTATSNYQTEGHDLKSDANGNTYITGTFGHHNLGGHMAIEGDSLVSRGGRDIFILKLDPRGKTSWLIQAGSSVKHDGYDYGSRLCLDNQGHLLVTGFFTGKAKFGPFEMESAGGIDIFLAKLNSVGQFLWCRRAGGSLSNKKKGSDTPMGIITDRKNNIYVVGHFSGQDCDFGPFRLDAKGSSDGFVAKYNPEGQIQWIRQIGGASQLKDSDVVTAIDMNKEGNIIIAGFFSDQLEIGNKIIQSKGLEDIFILMITPDGEIISIDQKTFIS